MTDRLLMVAGGILLLGCAACSGKMLVGPARVDSGKVGGDNSLALIDANPASSADSAKPSGQCVGAISSTSGNKYKLLRLCGDYTKMGEQYGQFAGAEIKNLYNVIYQQVGLAYGSTQRQAMIDYAKKTYLLYPERLKKIVAGAASTSGATLEQLMVINEFFTWVIIQDTSFGGAHCSNLTCWGAYTADQTAVMGRNFDFPSWFKNLSPYLLVVGLNPDDGSEPTALLAYAGQVGAIQAFNRAGLILADNDGRTCGDTARPWDSRPSFLVNAVTYLLDSAALSSLDQKLLGQQSTFPLIFTAADAHGGYVYETMTSQVKRRSSDPDGLLVATNHFLIGDWGTLPTPPANSPIRYNNLRNLAEKQRGKINPAVMRAIFDVPYSSGGVTNSSMVYQFVAQPSSGELWLKAANYSDWTALDLGAVLAP